MFLPTSTDSPVFRLFGLELVPIAKAQFKSVDRLNVKIKGKISLGSELHNNELIFKKMFYKYYKQEVASVFSLQI